jgi:DNA-directed RNA polymerase specialized sigma24 family protein
MDERESLVVAEQDHGRAPQGSQDGDREHLADLFRTIYPALRRYAAAIGSLESDPDDLVQDALAALLSRGSLDDLRHPESYLRRAVLHNELNRRRAATPPPPARGNGF